MASGLLRAIGGFVAALFLALGPASANVIGIESYMGHPDLAYTGDLTIQGTAGTIQGKVYRAPAQQRTDFSVHGIPFGSVVNLANGQAIIWSSAYQSYATTSLNDVGVRDWVPLLQNHSQVAITASGEPAQEVNGVMATRYDLSGVSPEGTPYTGQIWATDEGVIVRLVARIATVNGPITYNLTNLRVGQQPPTLFTVPEGYMERSWSEAAALLGM